MITNYKISNAENPTTIFWQNIKCKYILASIQCLYKKKHLFILNTRNFLKDGMICSDYVLKDEVTNNYIHDLKVTHDGQKSVQYCTNNASLLFGNWQYLVNSILKRTVPWKDNMIYARCYKMPANHVYGLNLVFIRVL